MRQAGTTQADSSSLWLRESKTHHRACGTHHRALPPTQQLADAGVENPLGFLVPVAAPSLVPTAISSSPADDAATATAARAFFARLLDSAKRALSGARPWSELADRSALSRPESLSEATSRLRKNLAYFRVNYAAVVALSLAAALLAHPFSLAALLALLAAWCLLYLLRPADAPPLAAFGRTFSDREVLGGLVAASAFVVFLTSVGSLIFSALALGAVVVCAHGACRVPEDLFLDDPDQAAGPGNPLLSFIANATGGRV